MSASMQGLDNPSDENQSVSVPGLGVLDDDTDFTPDDEFTLNSPSSDEDVFGSRRDTSNPPRFRISTLLSVLSTIGFIVSFVVLSLVAPEFNWMFSFLFLALTDILLIIASSSLLRYYKFINHAKVHSFVSKIFRPMCFLLPAIHIAVLVLFEYTDSCKSELIIIRDHDQAPKDRTASFCHYDYSGIQSFFEVAECYYSSDVDAGSIFAGSSDSGSTGIGSGTMHPMTSASDNSTSSGCGARLVSQADILHYIASESSGCIIRDTDSRYGLPVSVVIGEACTGDVAKIVSAVLLVLLQLFCVATLIILSEDRVFSRNTELSTLTGTDGVLGATDFELMDPPELERAETSHPESGDLILPPPAATSADGMQQPGDMSSPGDDGEF